MAAQIETTPFSARLVRHDLIIEDITATTTSETEVHFEELTERPSDRDDLIAKHNLPLDSIVKLKYEDKWIPWSLVQHLSPIEIQIFRQHQSIKPKIKENFAYDNLIREKVKRLEARIESLEKVMDPAVVEAKTEKDLELVVQQISLLTQRMELADQSPWIKKK